ncbi:hypothetical protein [Microbacterium aureliae]
MSTTAYPDHWTDAAVDVVRTVTSARPELDGAEAAMLGEAAELITAADKLTATAREAGLLATGSTGQTVVHPALVEARLTRAAAGALLSKLVPPRPAQGSRGGNGRFTARMDGTSGRRR